MGCKHEHLRTVGNRLFCKGCGKELPLEFLTAEKPQAEDATVGEIPVEIPPVEKKTGKAPAKKKTTKKAQ